jgi:hypothetical protein
MSDTTLFYLRTSFSEKENEVEEVHFIYFNNFLQMKFIISAILQYWLSLSIQINLNHKNMKIY